MSRLAIVLIILPALGLMQAGSAADGDQTFSGNASWYGIPFNGKKTASGELFDMNKLSGAHKTLPMLSKVMVENPKTGQAVVVKVNDRGPFVKTRVMDLSREGAKQLGYLSHGTAFLDFTVLPKSGKSTSGDSAGAKQDAQSRKSTD